MTSEAKQIFLATLREQSDWVRKVDKSQKHFLNERLKETGINQPSAAAMGSIWHLKKGGAFSFQTPSHLTKVSRGSRRRSKWLISASMSG